MLVVKVPLSEVSRRQKISCHVAVADPFYYVVDPSTPRDGTTRNPFQQDTTRFKGDAAATCGETLAVSRVYTKFNRSSL